ncbi:pleckstrin homology domain-containing family O member 1 isoform X5 [Apteryx mantelli]|uniref:Pleckstrin homology domain-containing family O member 1 isoform X5 n=1 Tax=Apteryx mantelli TaxID=2696672 RepID=A0ABM4FXB7_9AVES|nr:PREDICTED: pleckstrin homology domain-containing family O member 1 isoform X4 [Apteryx mantelli mantelli]
MMKKNNSAKRGQQDGNQQSAQPEKVGWVRKFCGKGIFREIWKNRYVVLKGDQLYISEKEVKDEKNMQEMFDLSDYEKCEELRKSKSRSKKNHSKFTLAHSRQPGNTVTVEEDSYLAHPTRDRAKIQHSRRPPTRGHLMAVASTSTSDGMLTLDLIQEEDASPEDHSTCEESFRVDLDKSVAHLTAGRHRSDSENVKSEKGRTGSLPRREVTSWDRSGQRNDSFDKGTMYTPQVPKKLSLSEKNKCASMEEILSRRDSSTHRAVLRRGLEAQFASAEPEQLSRIQELVALKLEKTQELLTEVKGYGEGKRKTKDSNTSTTTTSSSSSSSKSDSERILQESERLLGEASSTWSQAKRVLQEIKELRDLYKQFEQQQSDSKPKQSSQSQYRKSMM